MKSKNTHIKEMSEGYFWCPDWIFDLDILTKGEILVLVVLIRRSDKYGHCNPSIIGMARNTGMRPKTVVEAVRELEKKKYISVVRRHRVKNKYTLLDKVYNIQTNKRAERQLLQVKALGKRRKDNA